MPTSWLMLIKPQSMVTTNKQKIKYSIRVATYNIHAGADVDRNMQKIADDINALNLDIVGIQEVEVFNRRSKGVDKLKMLSELTGLPFYRFSKGINVRGGERGTGILSRYPITDHRTDMLISEGCEQRSVGIADIDVDGDVIRYCNTHLSYEDAFTRSLQLAHVIGAISEKDDYILTADFNTEDMHEFWILPNYQLANNGEFKTFPSSSTAIDNIIVSKGWFIEEVQMVETGHSDHNLLYAVLGKIIPKPPKPRVFPPDLL